jgi:hypothetical protein
MPRDLPIRYPEQARTGIVETTPEDLVCLIKEWFGDCAAQNDVEILAKYKYTETYSDWAVAVSNKTDTVEIVGDGLEIIVSATPLVPKGKADKNKVCQTWSLLVKDHSEQQVLIGFFYRLWQRYAYPQATLLPNAPDNELQIQQAIITFEVEELNPKAYNKRVI